MTSLSETLPPNQTNAENVTVKLRRFLEAYWLRPENALWMTLRSVALAKHKPTTPSLDLCCGDGLFTFLHLDGALEPSFDVFSSVAGLDRVKNEAHDMFDHATSDYQPAVIKHPICQIDVGCDLKINLIDKAQALNLYDRIVQHDCNETLPFADDSFEWVYCNAAYWVSHIAQLLSELRRITKSDGRVVLQVKLDSLQRYNLNVFRPLLGDRWLDIIGRGRLACWPALADRSTWEKRFADAGLSIIEATPFITQTHAHLWDVGLRPIAPLLVKMANGLTDQTRASIKSEWVDLFLELLEPFCNGQADLFGQADEPGEIQYVLST